MDPLSDARRLMALAETSEPPFAWNDAKNAAAYLGIPTISYTPRRDWPCVLAKWRFACADAMLKEMEAFDDAD